MKEKIKEKSIKLSARIFGIMTACLSSAIAAFAAIAPRYPDGYLPGS